MGFVTVFNVILFNKKSKKKRKNDNDDDNQHRLMYSQLYGDRSERLEREEWNVDSGDHGGRIHEFVKS